MYPLFTQSFWRDEAFSGLIALKSPSAIVSSMIQDQSPPLYFLLLHYWMRLFGTADLVLREFSLMWFIGSGMLLFAISGTYLKSTIARILVLFAFFCNPLSIQFAAEARQYSLFVFLTLLGVYLILKSKYFFASLALSLSVLTHNFGIFNLVSLGVWWIYENRLVLHSQIKHGLALFMLPFVAGSIWSLITISQLQRITNNFWITEKSTAMFTDLLQRFTQGNIWHESSSAVYLFSLIIVITGISYFLASKEQVKERGVILAGFLTLLPITITYLFSRFHTPIYNDRYLLASLPMLIIVVSYGLEQLWNANKLSKIILSLIIYAYLYSTFISYTQIIDKQFKPAINWGVNQVLLQASPDDLVVSEDPINFLEVKWYMRDNPLHIRPYSYFPHGSVPFYIGISAFDQGDVIKTLPFGKKVWVIQEDGGYHLQQSLAVSY